jgi:DNA-binding NarL/FixJ family response regulator
MPLRVVIADDHCHYRRALARMLRCSGVEVVAHVGGGEAAVRTVAATRPDVVLMNLYMPGLSSAEATRMIARRSPTTAVMILSVFADDPEVVDAMVAGASGYVLMDRPVGELLDAIRIAADGRPVVTPGLASALLQRFRDDARAEGWHPPIPARP